MILIGYVAVSVDPENRGRVKAFIPGFTDQETPTDYIERIGTPDHHFPPNQGDVIAVVVVSNPDATYQMFWLGVIHSADGTVNDQRSPLSLGAPPPEYRRLKIIGFEARTLEDTAINAGYIIGDLLTGTLNIRSDFGGAFVQIDSVEEEVNIDGAKVNLGAGGFATRGGF